MEHAGFIWIGGLLCASIAVPGPAPTPVPSGPQEPQSVHAARSEMEKLSALVGVFDLSASEAATDGSRFRESGSRTCQWVFGNRAILCEESRTLEEAVGRYQRLPANRRAMSLLRWNPSGSHFEELEIGPTGPVAVRQVTFDASRSTLKYDAVVESSSLNVTLDLASELTIGRDRQELIQRLRSQTTDLREEYRETAVRRGWPVNLFGRWTSTATHFHKDGTTLAETGRVHCVLSPAAVMCDRSYTSADGRSRIGLQMWTFGWEGGPQQVISVSPQSRVVQQVTRVDGRELLLEGAVALPKGPVRTRGRWEAVGAEMIYRNETEESAGQWRVDYEERLVRTPE